MSPCFLSCQPLPWPCPAFWPVASGIISGIRRGTPFPFFLLVFSPYKGVVALFAFLFPAVFLCRSAFSLSDSPDIFPFPLSLAHVYIIYNVSLSLPFFSSLSFSFLQPLCFSVFYSIFFIFFLKKRHFCFVVFSLSATFASAFGNEGFGALT